MQFGMRKAMGSGRVIIGPGPVDETTCVRDMFNMLLRRNMGCSAIARELNRQGRLRRNGHAWSSTTVHNLLTNPIYQGTSAWARTTQKMRTRSVPVGEPSWVVKHGAFQSIISARTYSRAQAVLKERALARRWPQERILSAARKLLKRAGYLSEALMDSSPSMPGSRTIRAHFGSHRRLYELVGYDLPAPIYATQTKIKTTLTLRSNLARRIVDLFSPRVTLLPTHTARRMLLVDEAVRVSIVICRRLKMEGHSVRWNLVPNPHERDNMSLVCLLNEENTEISRMFLFPRIDIPQAAHQLREDDKWLRNGLQLAGPDEFCEAVRSTARQR